MAQLTYGTSELRNICEKQADAVAELEEEGASALRVLLDEIRSINFIGEVQNLLFWSLEQVNNQSARIKFADNQYLTFTPSPYQMPQDGVKINWNNVSRIHVIKIGFEQ
jgi:hypothetical protein